LPQRAKGVHTGDNVRVGRVRTCRPLSSDAAGGAGGTVKHGIAVLQGATFFTAASARLGAVSFGANPFLRWQTRPLAWKRLCDFSVAGQVYPKRHTMISGTVLRKIPGKFPGIFPGYAI